MLRVCVCICVFVCVSGGVGGGEEVGVGNFGGGFFQSKNGFWHMFLRIWKKYFWFLEEIYYWFIFSV